MWHSSPHGGVHVGGTGTGLHQLSAGGLGVPGGLAVRPPVRPSGQRQRLQGRRSIDPGDDFVRVIGDAVGSCQVLLALIGDRWLDITDGTGHRRLDDPEDFVRLEIEAALRRDVRVIPILVGRAPLPGSEQLPDSLRGLIRRQAIELSPNRFEPDVARLVRTIDKTLAAIGEGPVDAPAPVDRTSRWPGPAATDRPEAPAEGRGNLLADRQCVDARAGLAVFRLLSGSSVRLACQ